MMIMMMKKKMAHLLLALALVLSLSLATAADVVSETCKHSAPHYDLCVKVLSSDASSHNADAHDLAKIALNFTAKKASATATDISTLLEKPLDNPNLQACLTDCFDEYVDAIDQLNDAQPALDDRDYVEAATWLEAALADVEACRSGCKEVPGNTNELVKKNDHVTKLCSITLAIVKLLKAKH